MNTLLLRPFSFSDPDRVVRVTTVRQIHPAKRTAADPLILLRQPFIGVERPLMGKGALALSAAFYPASITMQHP